MASVSAVVLIGRGHPNDGGNRHFAVVSLEEGSRPSFNLEWRSPSIQRELGGLRSFTMIPTVEDTLHDCLLYVAFAVARVPEVVTAIESARGNGLAGHPIRRLEMYDDFAPRDRGLL